MAARQKPGPNPGGQPVVIHKLPAQLYKRARKRAVELAQVEADRTGCPVAIVDEQAGRVLNFVRPRKPRLNPARGRARYRVRRTGGRSRIEIFR